MSVENALDQLHQHLSSLLPEALIEAQSLQQCPEIRLYLLNADYPQWQLDTDAVARLMDEPPYWAFCWASGQVLARYLLDHPQRVAGRHVVDFGAGSGVVGIAAALAGAARVDCCDIDPVARLAVEANARLNGVELNITHSMPAERPDVLTLADVLYDRANLPLVESLVTRASTLLLADSRIRNLALEPFRFLAQYDSCTWPDLDESAEFNRVRLYCAETAKPMQ